ncbi:MAG: hypothetical protein AABY93_00515 [Bacteroidota bacterium]
MTSPVYHSIYATLTIDEKNIILAKGGQVVGCFEEEFDTLGTEYVNEDYFITSLASDRYINGFNLDTRLTILKKEKGFWESILAKHSPVAIVNEIVAIEISEVLYIECKKRGIRYLAWLNHPIDNYFYWLDTPMNSSLSPSIFAKSPKTESVILVSNYCSKVEQNYKPFYVRDLKSRFNLIDILKDIKSTGLTLRTRIKYNKIKSYSIFGADYKFYLWRLNLILATLGRKYDDLRKYNQYEILFFPLHYEPEATLFYMAEWYSSQIDTIYNISKCIKLNQVLVVKEHPVQRGMLLTEPFQKLKKKTSNVIYLPGEHNSQDLILSAKAIITLTSTVGLEALILGKPVIVMGNVFFDRYQYITKIKSFDELRSIIRSDAYIYPDKKTIIDFLANLLDHSFKGNPFPHSNLYIPENIKLIIEAIESEVLAMIKA